MIVRNQWQEGFTKGVIAKVKVIDDVSMTSIHLRSNVITSRTWLLLGSVINFRPSTPVN